MALAEQLKEVIFTRAFTSDYERALGTAKILLNNPGSGSSSPLAIDKRIRERVMTRFQCKSVGVCISSSCS